ncbi:ComEC/Rec2 family competence protein [Brevibacterium otitidis]|uniref:ComEC/Rec2 family competence protein n=1 Tax=Brevibacterium otitidis TaxID=53364 RepID=A0ABV5X317_9MICO
MTTDTSASGQAEPRRTPSSVPEGTAPCWGVWVSTLLLHRAGLHRLIVTAAAAWIAASGVFTARSVLITGGLLATASAAILLTVRFKQSSGRQLAGWILSAVLLAAAVAALIGAARIVQPTETTLYSGPALIAAESQATATGSYRTEILTDYGPASALSQQPLPTAGSHTIVRAELHPSGAETVAFIRGTPQIRSRPAPIWQLRAHLRHMLATASGTAHDGGRLLPGLVIGDVSQIGDDLSEAMRTVSLSHVTAVSGANITIVSLAVLWATGFALRGRFSRIIVAVIVTAGYVFIVGPEPSVTRAAGMGLVGALAMLRGTRTASLALLAAGIIAVLIYRPGLSTSVGFHLSVSATAALIILGRPVTELLTAWRLPRFLAAALAVPLSAQAGVTPVLISIDSTLSAWSVPANALAAPAVAPATLLGMVVLACGLLPFGEVIAAVLAAPANWCAWWIAAVARVCAALPASELPWPVGLLGISLSCVVIAGLCLLVIEHRRARRFGAGIIAAAMLAGLLIPGIRTPVSADWRVMFCDVGQGSATLISLPGDDVLVIDTGEDDSHIDICLDRTGDRRVHLMISHFDVDHYGGYAGTAEGREVAAVYFPAAAAEDPGLAEIARDLPDAEQIPVSAGQQYQFGTIRWTILWPLPTATAHEAQRDSNAVSLVVHADLGEFSVLIPGDVGAEAQRQLAAATPPVDVLAAPHHGSGDIDEAFFHAARPRLGIVSVGADNTYGHPTTRALAAFGASPVLRTDECATIVIDVDRQVTSGCQSFVLG